MAVSFRVASALPGHLVAFFKLLVITVSVSEVINQPDLEVGPTFTSR